jgi:hypothetical protein
MKTTLSKMGGLLGLLVLFVVPVTTSAVERVPAFDVRLVVENNATVRVTERVVYDFDDEEKHGIFRAIPYSYQAGTATYRADIDDVTVVQEDGEPWLFTESRSNGELRLKIGDPAVKVRGMQTYLISYTVRGPFLYFKEKDELYWNVTGSWSVEIEEATVLVDLPEGASVIDAACYKGLLRERTPCDEALRLTNAERAGYSAVAYNIPPEGGFSIAVAFPKGTIAEIRQPWHQGPRSPFVPYLPLAIPILTLSILPYLWYTRGRDPEGRKTIVVEYEPPQGLSPALAGVVYNERIEPQEVSAEILRLAVEGFIRIHRIEKKIMIKNIPIASRTDHLFERLRDEETPNDPIARLVLERLFQVMYIGTEDIDGRTVSGSLLSKMQNKFVSDYNMIVDTLYEEVYARRYFVERPDKVRQRFVIAGSGCMVAGFGIMFLAGTSLFILGGSVILSGVLIMVGGIFMPAKTRAGVLAKEHVEGFKRYLTIAEKDRLTFHNAPERTPEQFDAFLPYAVALGVEQAWAEQFKGVYTQPPQWYSGSGSALSATAFVRDVKLLSADIATNTAPRSSGSSGGGSVGGGFGGGRGGSW